MPSSAWAGIYERASGYNARPSGRPSPPARVRVCKGLFFFDSPAGIVRAAPSCQVNPPEGSLGEGTDRKAQPRAPTGDVMQLDTWYDVLVQELSETPPEFSNLLKDAEVALEAGLGDDEES